MQYLVKLPPFNTKHLRHLISRIRPVTGRSKGKIVLRHRSGFQKLLYRFIDYKRSLPLESKGLVLRHAYLPRIGERLTLVLYLDGVFLNILKPAKITVGSFIENMSTEPKIPGDSGPLCYMPTGSALHNISLRPLGPGIITRGSGCSSVLIRIDRGASFVKLKSGEIRLFDERNTATLGTLGNEGKFLLEIGKAGKSRHLGRRPITRAYAMNPVTIPWEAELKVGHNHYLLKDAF